MKTTTINTCTCNWWKTAATAFTSGVIGAGLMLICMLFTGGGHGTYKPLTALFPITMVSIVFGDTISLPFILLGLAEYPTYATLLLWAYRKHRLKGHLMALVAFHVLFAATLFVWPNHHFAR